MFFPLVLALVHIRDCGALAVSLCPSILLHHTEAQLVFSANWERAKAGVLLIALAEVLADSNPQSFPSFQLQ